MLHLIHLPVDLNELHHQAARRGWMTDHGLDEGHALHHFLTECFGQRAIQPFRLMVAPGKRAAALYAYAIAASERLMGTAAAVAPPELAGVFDLPGLRGKPMPGFRTGQKLGFDLLVRPVVRLASDLPVPRSVARPAHRKGDETDAFLAHVVRAAPEGEAEPTRRETIYLDWLGSRLRGSDLEPGASHLARFARRAVHRGGRTLEGPDAVIHGTLTVSDPNAFTAMLARGVGRHCAYGYGMMLLRPPSARPMSC